MQTNGGLLTALPATGRARANEITARHPKGRRQQSSGRLRLPETACSTVAFVVMSLHRSQELRRDASKPVATNTLCEFIVAMLGLGASSWDVPCDADIAYDEPVCLMQPLVASLTCGHVDVHDVQSGVYPQRFCEMLADLFDSRKRC